MANKELALKVFIEFSEELYPECYDYSEVNYIDTKTEVTIICK